MTVSVYSELISSYVSGGAALTDAVTHLSEAELLHHRQPEKWSIKQIAVHLADAELAVSFRVRNIISEDAPPIQPFDQDKWTDNLDYEGLDLSSALERFRLLRSANGILLERLTEAQWQRTAVHPANGPLSLEQLVAGQIEHVNNHIDQIRSSLEHYRAGK